MKKIIYITALWFVSCLNIWAVPVVVNIASFPVLLPINNTVFEYDLLFSVGYRALAAQPCSMDKAGTFFIPAGTSLDITGQSIPMNENNCIQNNLFNISCFVPDVDFHWSGVRFSIQSPPPVPPGPLPPVPVNSYMGAVKGGITCASDNINGILYTPPFPPGAPITGDYVITCATGIFGNGPKMSFVDLGVVQIYNFY